MNNPTSNSSVDYQQVKRGLPASEALTTSNSSVADASVAVVRSYSQVGFTKWVSGSLCTKPFTETYTSGVAVPRN